MRLLGLVTPLLVASAVGCTLFSDVGELTAGGPPGDASSAPTGDDAGSDAPSLASFGTPEIVASDLSSPTYLGCDQDQVFWVQGASTLVSKPAMSPGGTTVLAQALDRPRALVVGPNSVFFAAAWPGGWTYVNEVPKGGGNLGRTYGTGSGGASIPALSVEGTAVALCIDGRIVRGNTDGTGAFDVARDQPATTTVLLRAPYVYWNAPAGISRSDGAAPKAPELFTTESMGTTEFVADATTVYWTAADGKLRSLPFDRAGTTATILDTGIQSPRGLAVDARYVYWASATSGVVAAVPKGGGARIVLASGQADPYALAASATAVFFTNRTAGTVIRIPKR